MTRPIWRRVGARVRAQLTRPERRALTLQERFPQYSIGRHTYGPLRVRDDGDGSTLSIGAFTSIADGATIFTGGEHRPDWVTTFPFNVLWPAGHDITGHPHSKGDVIIGNDVWLGAECLILSGVTIGDGAIVGARAVVTTDVPSYAIAVGSPARVVRHRFTESQRAALAEIRWWSWPDHEIEAALPQLLDQDIDRFIELARSGAFRARP